MTTARCRAWVLALLLAAAALRPAPPATAGTAPSPEPLTAADWPIGPGWAASYQGRSSDGPVVIDAWFVEEITHEGRAVAVIADEVYGGGLDACRRYLTRDEEGDVYLVGVSCFSSDEGRWYDPPLKIVDFPLADGQAWDTRTRRYRSPDLSGPGEPEHHRFRVAGTEQIPGPKGPTDAFRVVDDPAHGEGLGTVWYAADIGPCRVTVGAGGEVLTLAALGEDGPGSLDGVGTAVALEFGWRPGAQARVETYTYESRAEGAPGSRPQPPPGGVAVARGAYSLTVGDDPRGLVVRRDESGRPPQAFLVVPDGRFAGLAAPAAVAEAPPLLASGSWTDAADVPSPCAGQTAGFGLQHDWNIMVGMWLGYEGHTRIPTGGEASLASPLEPLTGAGGRFRLAAVGDAACGDEDSAGHRCVQMVFGGVADPEQAAAAMGDFVGTPTSDARFGDVHILTRVEVFMQPETMLPHRVRYDRRARYTVRTAAGEARRYDVQRYENLELTWRE